QNKPELPRIYAFCAGVREPPHSPLLRARHNFFIKIKIAGVENQYITCVIIQQGGLRVIPGLCCGK
ncbi:MAG TPA: hypothetical protein PKW28_08315, partial [Turneriella sp.]|nr:hypothetical protein [Turneriella sp.]